jgi:hypothetical protein
VRCDEARLSETAEISNALGTLLAISELADALRSNLVNPEKVQIRETDEWAVPRLVQAPGLSHRTFATSGMLIANAEISHAH